MKGISIEEDINGVNVSFNDTIVNFDVNSLNIEKLKTIEKGAIFALLNHMQAHFLDLPFIELVFIKEDVEEIVECNYISDYEENMLKIKTAVDKFVQTAEKGAKNKFIEENFLIANDVRHSYKEVATLMNKALPIFTTARKIEQFCAEDLTKDRYLELITELNKKFSKQIDNVNKFVKDTSGSFIGDKEIYGKYLELFRNLTKDMNIEFLKKEDENKKVESNESLNIVKKSTVELERDKYIKKANDLYNQLCYDWLPDLKNQTPFSVKDKYKCFMTKLKKFNDTFKMPLDNTVSLGMAKEVCSQINNLMDYISNISSEAYTISVYDEK